MRKVFYVLIGLVLLYVILCFIGPAEVKVERSIEISTPADEIQHRLADLKFFHDKWSPWTKRDPQMKTTYSGVCCEPGSKYAWESNKDSVGKGSMTFDGFTKDSVLLTLHFDGMGDSKVYYITSPTSDKVKLTWGMIFKVGFFGRAPMLFMSMDKMIGPDFESGLSSLKQVLETMEPETKLTDYKIEDLEWKERTFIGKKGLYKFSELSKLFGEVYPKLGEYVGKNKVEMDGAPFAIYFSYDEKNMQTECAAVFAVKNIKEAKGWETFKIPASHVLKIAYYGAYDKSANAHYAMDNYMKEKGMTQSFVLEEYVTDPMMEKDTAKWLTNIYYVLK